MNKNALLLSSLSLLLLASCDNNFSQSESSSEIISSSSNKIELSTEGSNSSSNQSESSSEVSNSTSSNQSESSSEASNSTSSNQSESSSSVAEVTPYTVSFVHDSHISIYVYNSQNYEIDPTLATSAVAVDADTGEVKDDGSGQINFKVICDEGYTYTMMASADNYKNIKSSKDDVDIPENVYRITKITGDFTLTFTTSEIQQEREVAYTITFNIDPNVDVYYYEGQDYSVEPTKITDTLLIYQDTLEYDSSDEAWYGQINIKVVCKEGYEFISGVEVGEDTKAKNISFITGSYNKFKHVEENIYRVTKISSDLVITISATSK